MNKWLALFMMMLVALRAFPQVQQGYVKTIGRPNVSGSYLGGGVTVRVSGNINTLVSGQNGSFSFPIKEQRFRFSRVSKKGYEIADHDFYHYDFHFSPNVPIIVAMVSKEQLQKERDAIEEQVRNKLELRFQEKNAILERKLERNMLAEEDFKRQILALHEERDNIDTLVSILSDRYARTDYDHIDSTKLVINQCIENGELERAQQIIMSKGSIEERTEELENTRKLRLQVQERETKLQKDLADDLFQLYEIACTNHKYDSAYVYLEKRYLTDTTSVKFLYDLTRPTLWAKGEIGKKDERIVRQESYLLKLHDKVSHQELASQLGLDIYQAMSKLEDELGEFYHSSGNDEKALPYFEKMLQTMRNGNLGHEYVPLQKMGNVYMAQNAYEKSLSAYQEALKYRSSLFVLTKIGDLHFLLGDKENALNDYISAERMFVMLNDLDNLTIQQLYILQGFIGNIFLEKGNNKGALTYYNKAVDNAEKYYNLTKEIKNISPIIILLRVLQGIYAMQGKAKQELSCAEKMIYYAEMYMSRFPSSYSKLLYAEALCQRAEALKMIDEEAMEYDRVIVDALPKIYDELIKEQMDNKEY